MRRASGRSCPRGCCPRTSPRSSRGPYHAEHGSHRGIDLGVYCRQSLAEHLDADEIIEITAQGLDFYEQVFDTRTRSRSTTRCSCPSSTPARWRTPGASPSSSPTCSARRSPMPSVSDGPRRSSTSSRTCGSATSSPCAGGTTCGSTSASPPTPRSWRRPRPRAHARGRRSPTRGRPGPTARTSCRPPIPSRPTWSTPTRCT